MRSILIFSIVVLQLVAGASAQTDDVAHPKTPITFAFVELQPSGNLLVKETTWVVEQVEQSYTVNVPVTEERMRTVDGKQETYSVTMERQETKTRMVAFMKAVPVSQEIPQGEYSLYLMNGRKLSSISSGGQPAILVKPYEKLDVWYRKIVRPDTLVVTIKAPANQASAEMPPPAPAVQ